MADMIDLLIAREGGAKVVAHPNDPGGVTKYGISQRAYPDIDIRNLTYEQARLIYTTDYLVKPGINKLTHPILCEMTLDFAVHSGVRTAIKSLQKLLGVQRDGVIGPQTVAAANAATATEVDAQPLISTYGRERIGYLIRQCQTKPDKLTFLNGWIMRVLNLYT